MYAATAERDKQYCLDLGMQVSWSSVRWQRGLSEIVAHFVHAHYIRSQLAVREYEDYKQQWGKNKALTLYSGFSIDQNVDLLQHCCDHWISTLVRASFSARFHHCHLICLSYALTCSVYVQKAAWHTHYSTLRWAKREDLPVFSSSTLRNREKCYFPKTEKMFLWIIGI